MPKERSFLSDYADNLNVYGTDAGYGYYTIMFCSILFAPIIILGYALYTSQNPRKVMSHAHVRAIYRHGVLSGIYVWFVCAAVFMFSPVSMISFIINITLTSMSIVIIAISTYMLIFPGEATVTRVALTKELGCQVCEAVKSFLEDNGSECNPEQLRDRYGSYIYTLHVPALKKGLDSSAEAGDFAGIDADRMKALDSVYQQVAQHWCNVPAFQKHMGAIMDEATTTVSFGTMTPAGMRKLEEKSKPSAGHELSLLLSQGLVKKGIHFDENMTYDVINNPMCSFVLEKGVSDVAKAEKTGLVTVGNVGNAGAISNTKLFTCANMSAALPYLLNGYKMSEHSMPYKTAIV